MPQRSDIGRPLIDVLYFEVVCVLFPQEAFGSTNPSLEQEMSLTLHPLLNVCDQQLRGSTAQVPDMDIPLEIQAQIEQQQRSSNELLVYPKNFKSKVWKYFGFKPDPTNGIDMTYAICRVCGQNVKYTGNTTNASSHLINHHNIDVIHSFQNPKLDLKREPLYDAHLYTGSDQSGTDGEFSSSRGFNFDLVFHRASPLLGMADSNQSEVPTSSEHVDRLPEVTRTLITTLANYLVQNMNPVSTVDNPSFHQLLVAMSPQNALLLTQVSTLRSIVRHTICDQMYTACQESVQRKISK